MADINPIASAASPQQQGSSVPGGNATQAVSSQGQLSQTGSSSVAAPQAAQGASSQAGNTGSGGTRQVSDRQQVLRHQQQRLLLLRHAAKCQHDDQRCPVTPHCAGMKRLWKHIAECKDQKCLVPHCVSSRYVLSHYHRCKDVRCPVCGPVREAIHRSHEKQKQMQALKARHQQALASSGAGAQQAAAIPTADQASKRRKSNSGIAVPSPGYASVQNGTVVRSQNYALAKSGIPHQLPQQVKPGYVYSQSGGAIRPGQPHPSIPGLAYSNGQVIMPKHSGPKPQEDHTLINCFSIPEIETHIQSLNKGLQLSPQQLKTKCLDVLKVLQSHQHGWVFNSPVDPVELGLPDYFEVIKRPMDLGTIKKKLENGCYHSLEEFKENVNLTFDNAMLYNPEGSVVYNMAKEMKAKFKSDYALLIRALEAEEDAKRKNGEACVLCGCEKLLFEPPAFYCNGPNCPSKRIRRNSYYYVGGNNQYHWCHQCFADLKDRQLIELGDITLKKEQLIKKKNDETHEESWVQCDKCERWVHQICSLFNTRQNKDHRSEFMCPRCTIADRKSKGITEGTSSTPMAEDLPRTKLSETLERHVRKKVDEYFDKMARDQAEKEVRVSFVLFLAAEDTPPFANVLVLPRLLEYTA
jgi:E1A/CREB-binding protein